MQVFNSAAPSHATAALYRLAIIQHQRGGPADHSPCSSPRCRSCASSTYELPQYLTGAGKPPHGIGDPTRLLLQVQGNCQNAIADHVVGNVRVALALVRETSAPRAGVPDQRQQPGRLIFGIYLGNHQQPYRRRLRSSSPAAGRLVLFSRIFLERGLTARRYK